MTVLLAVVTAAISAAAPAPAYWQRVEACGHGHRRQIAADALDRLLRNHEPLTARRREHATHLRRCVLTRRDRRAVAKRWRQLRAWRESYPHRWPITFNRLPAGDRAWATSTGACESGNNPATNTDNGFLGAFQFLPATWHAAGGTGLPHHHSWHYQAVIAVGWMHRAGQGQWPVCG